MSSLFGPQIAFVEDIEAQVAPITKVLSDELQVASVIYDPSPDRNNFPEYPLNSVKLIFLDLYYGGPVDPYRSAEWVTSIIPPNTKYSLVIWSTDTQMEGEVFRILQDLDYQPTHYEVWQKTNFDINRHDFRPMIRDLIRKISDSNESIDIVLGQIVEVEEDGFLVNCLMDLEIPTFQLRKFDKELFDGLGVGFNDFVKICIRTQPGTRVIDVFVENESLAEKFLVTDYFEHLKGTAFFTEE